jgi:hypothetical protein
MGNVWQTAGREKLTFVARGLHARIIRHDRFCLRVIGRQGIL